MLNPKTKIHSINAQHWKKNYIPLCSPPLPSPLLFIQYFLCGLKHNKIGVIGESLILICVSWKKKSLLATCHTDWPNVKLSAVICECHICHQAIEQCLPTLLQARVNFIKSFFSKLLRIYLISYHQTYRTFILDRGDKWHNHFWACVKTPLEGMFSICCRCKLIVPYLDVFRLTQDRTWDRSN